MNIIWKKPSGSIAISSVADGIDPQKVAAELVLRGSVDPSWTAVAYGVTLPDAPVDAMRFDGRAISVDVGSAAAIAEAHLVSQFSAAIQSHLDAQAVSLGYESIATAVTYADEPAVPRFQAEGRALRAWRSQVWASAYATLAAVKSGAQTMPTVDALIASLPPF